MARRPRPRVPRYLLGIFAAGVELVGNGKLRVKPAAKHEFEQDELRRGERRTGRGAKLLHVVPELELDVLRG